MHPPRRHPCRRCRSRIDQDHLTCPFCEATDPLRYLRVRRNLSVFAVLAAVFVSAWVALT
jgi:hypothetical protein